MMKILFNVLMVLLVASCSTSSKKSKGAPNWIVSPGEGCDKSKYLCASAESTSLEEADVNARKSLAAMFKSRIQSIFKSNMSSSMTNDEAEELSQEVYDSVQESVDVVLKGSFVKSRYIKNGLYYSLVALDKRKSSKQLRSQIKDIDDEIFDLYSTKRRTSVPKLLVLYDKRQLLNEKYLFIKGRGIPEQVSLSKILSLKKGNGVSKIVLAFSEDFPTSLKSWVEQHFTKLNYKITTTPPANYTLKANFEKKEEFLNVKGFKKYSFNVNLSSYDSLSQRVGELNLSVVQTGRNDKDAYLRSKDKIKSEIVNNLNELNME